jgi:hypothetical protein
MFISDSIYLTAPFVDSPQLNLYDNSLRYSGAQSHVVYASFGCSYGSWFSYHHMDWYCCLVLLHVNLPGLVSSATNRTFDLDVVS